MPNPRANGDGVMHNLVVCGAVDAQSPIDAAIFSDFMGISMTLELAAEGAEITALSCFPLDEHFNFLETRAPPITTIKWGILGTNQTPPEDILRRVTAWIQDKAHSVAENDVVNIFFEAHGIMNGKICLGSKYLETSKVASLLSQFPTSCQVNVVGRHCYSGRFRNVIKADGQILRHAIADCGLGEAVHFAATRSVSNRIRYSRFSLPFVRSLAQVSFPWLPPKVHLPVPTAEHQTILREAIRRITPSLAQDCQAETYASSLFPEVRASVTLLEELVLRDHVDVMFLKQTVHRRRRSEWPTLDPQLMQQMQREISPPSSSLLRRSQDHIHAAAAECDFDNALMDDGPIVGKLEYRIPHMVKYYEPFTIELPSGVGNDPSLIPDIIIERLAFFNKTEALFKELLRLGDAELLLERQRFAIGQG
ncbi:hypothetical protein TESG_07769 [Trichophyton tonsurans CBS 112818]|uniref:Uncharacterized protein n=1 Tax=Trichophyton tonsurans (strain CBS 112818) TaxID=647933 RepID=F2SA25_TRIT1|nr:hypothetical protein TESG_07769 [Trichophyton tonsurans CBS 112818]